MKAHSSLLGLVRALPLALVAGLLAIAPVAATAEEPPPTTGVVAGTITEQGTGTPAAGVWVRPLCEFVDDPGTEYEYIYWDWCYEGDNVLQTQTAADGGYQLTVPAATYRIEVSSDYYDEQSDDYIYGPWDHRYYLDAGSSESAQDVIVNAGTTVSNVDVALSKRGVISGHVQTGAAAPISGVSVTAHVLEVDDLGNGEFEEYWYSYRTARTDSNGDYRLYLPAGEYKVGYSHTAWKPTYFNGVATRDAAQRLVLAAGATTGNIDATLISRPSITGRVEGEDGSPLSGAYVTAYKHFVEQGPYPYDYWDAVYTATTNSSGDYQLHVDAGEWRVGFSRSGWKPEYYDSVAAVADAASFTVAGDTVTPGIDAVLTKLGAIEGTVTNSQGLPLEDVAVRAYKQYSGPPASWNVSTTAYTDTQGRYSLPVDDGTLKRPRFDAAPV